MQTYWDIINWNEEEQRILVSTPKKLMVDSGAFSFMHSGAKTDFGDYVKSYADFVKKHKIELYLELDLDTVIGVDKTTEIRKWLTKYVGYAPIPVFHVCRGIDEWYRMIKKYKYVAIGASALTEECKWTNNKKTLRYMLQDAHDCGCMVHGLGYTRLSNINDTTVFFDSVDSTACLAGGRFGIIYHFKNGKMTKEKATARMSYKVLNDHNVKQWVLMQKYKDGQNDFKSNREAVVPSFDNCGNLCFFDDG